MNSSHYPRPQLAIELADALTGKTPFSDAPNGLFLAEDRRTGKSQFLRLDLLPELQRRGLLALYVDLKVSAATPTQAVQQMLFEAVQSNSGLVSKFAKSVGLEKITVPGMLTLDVSGIGKTEGLSLYQVLNVLHQATKKPIVLIIDEAQHALTHDEGEALMWALKSARDQMKTVEGANLMLVMSGSHTDKLTLLLNSRRAPFWGSQVRSVPKLDDKFVESYAAKVRLHRPELGAIRTSVMVDAFEHFGRRPQFFIDAVGRAASTSHDGQAFEAALVAQGKQRRGDDRDRFTSIYLALSPIEQALLERILIEGKSFRPFDADALAFYAQRIGKPKVSAQVAQRAIDSLRNNDEELVWKSLRGDYSVYDQSLNDWYAFLLAAGQWPPEAVKR